MAVRIRLSRGGNTHRPHYRIVATDSREHREGAAIEILGVYDPLAQGDNVRVDADKLHNWIRLGANPTEGAASILKHAGVQVYPEDVLERRAAQKAKKKAKRAKAKKKDGTTFAAPSRRARQAHKKSLKQAESAKREEALAAHKASQTEASDEAEGSENAES